MSTTTPFRRRERIARRHNQPATAKTTTADTPDADVWRRRAAAWPEYAPELLALAEQTEPSQQTTTA